MKPGFSGVVTRRSSTKRIVIHHSASPATTTCYDIQKWHIQRGWSGIGYHYIIHADGAIFEGRPEYTKGAHAYQDSAHEANTDGIGICLCGNFMTALPTLAQMESLAWLIKDIWTRYPDIPVIGHKDVMATACPGKLFPWADLNKRLEGKVVEQWKIDIMNQGVAAGLIDAGKHQPDEPADKWFVLAVALDVLKAVK